LLEEKGRKHQDGHEKGATMEKHEENWQNGRRFANFHRFCQADFDPSEEEAIPIAVAEKAAEAEAQEDPEAKSNILEAGP